MALVWCNDHEEEKRFTFTDISLMSNQAANFFSGARRQKGPVVMLILRRRWEYWICATALHKIRHPHPRFPSVDKKRTWFTGQMPLKSI